MWQIKKAKITDIEEILAVFHACTAALLKAGIFQWDGTYPTAEVFENDIKSGSVFVVKKAGQILGTITLNDQQDEQYKAINWKFEAKKVLVIHRLAVSPNAQGMGVGKGLCVFAESFGVENGFELIRLDAYSGNPVSCGMYEKLKYHRADGFCHFHGNELPFYCFEKKLPEVN